MKICLRREKLPWHQGQASLNILHLSDLHLKWKGRSLCQVEPLIAALQPDVIAMTGDYYDTPRGAAVFLAFVERVSRRCPVYWIRGNHDRWLPAKSLQQLRQLPQTFCVDDQACTYRSPGGTLYEIVSWAQHLSVLPQRNAGQRRIVLLHNPERIAVDRLAGCDLLLAGHLHGAQFIFRRCHDGSFFPGNLLYRWCGDRHEIDATTVIVSKGLGDTLPLRFRCPKEVVFVEIR